MNFLKSENKGTKKLSKKEKLPEDLWLADTVVDDDVYEGGLWLGLSDSAV